MSPLPSPVAFENVKLYDSDAEKFRDAMTVVVNNGRIVSVGPAAKAKVVSSNLLQ